jgi:Predicted amidohydrolase
MYFPDNPDMRVAMIPLEVVPGDIPQNTERVIRWMARAAREAADLVLFPEAALTGLINTDDPATIGPWASRVPMRRSSGSLRPRSGSGSTWASGFWNAKGRRCTTVP